MYKQIKAFKVGKKNGSLITTDKNLQKKILIINNFTKCKTKNQNGYC